MSGGDSHNGDGGQLVDNPSTEEAGWVGGGGIYENNV